jgi:tRNA U38,U39,U40 pseudouridine synthase TruA
VNDGLNLELKRPKRKKKVAFLIGYRGGGISGNSAAKSLMSILEQQEGWRVNSLSRCTDHKHRCSALFESGNMHAVEDVLVANVEASGNFVPEEASKEEWLAKLNEKLQRVPLLHGDARGEIKVHDAEDVHDDYFGTLQAEGSCTARVYECVLPFGYLSDVPPPTSSEDLKLFSSRFKKILVSLTSPKSPSKGGFRHRWSQEQVEARESQRWHNFCGLSRVEPTDAAVQRTIERFRMVDSTREHDSDPNIIAKLGSNSHSFVRIRVCADGVLSGQVERMVGAAVCIFRGWLPPTFPSIALDPNTIMTTPALSHRLVFLSHARFDWNSPKQPIFRRKNRRSTETLATVPAFEAALLYDIATSEAASDVTLAAWLAEMKNTVCPQINSKLADISSNQGIDAQNKVESKESRSGDCPPAYAQVLRLLRDADASGVWPSTSRARARVVIAGAAGEEGSGSFSAASPSALASCESGDPTDDAFRVSSSRGNDLFPELIQAVFDLERAIAPDRPPSTMVAINRRASFLPHTDAGAGFGQSKSLIVGLGDYRGGQLAVEEKKADIRYAPLTFDGWRERHWTLPFQGERFSLVWFTPAARKQEKLTPRYAAPSHISKKGETC